MPKALIKNGLIDTISHTDVGPDWVDVPEDVFAGFIDHGDGTFTAPKPEPYSTDPVDYPLNPAQFDAILSIIGITICQIETAVDQIPLSDEQRAFAKAKVRKATAYHRDNELFSLLAPIMGISEPTIDAAWMQAISMK